MGGVAAAGGRPWGGVVSERPRAGIASYLLFAITPLVLLLGGLELILNLVGFEGTSMAEQVAAQGFPAQSYVHRRDRLLGPWYLPSRDRQGWMVSNPQWLPRGFHNEVFQVDDRQGMLLFALGGSTTVGLPFEREGRGFPGRLEALLRDAGLGHVRVVNAGVAGMDALAFPPRAEELLELNPDGLLIYAGNNEIPGQLIEECSDPLRLGVEQALNEVATVRLMRTAYVRLWGRRRLAQIQAPERDQRDCMTARLREALAAEPPQARPTRGGAGAWWPYRDDGLYRRTVETFEDHLKRVVSIASAEGVQVWLAVPPINLLDPPNRSFHAPWLTRDERDQVRALAAPIREAREREDWATVISLAELALSVDPGYAELHYRLGMALKEVGRIEEARVHLRMAAEWDYLGDRITPSLQDAVWAVCSDQATVECVDVEAEFNRAAELGLPGADLFVDFCHPTREEGTDLIARAFFRSITDQGGPGRAGARSAPGPGR